MNHENIGNRKSRDANPLRTGASTASVEKNASAIGRLARRIHTNEEKIRLLEKDKNGSK